MLTLKRVVLLSALVVSNVALAGGSRTPREGGRRISRKQMECQRALHGTYEQYGSDSAYMIEYEGQQGDALFDDGNRDDRSGYPQY